MAIDLRPVAAPWALVGIDLRREYLRVNGERAVPLAARG